MSSTDASRAEDAAAPSSDGGRTGENDENLETTSSDGRSAIELAALGLVAGLSGGVAATALDPGHPLLAVLVVLVVAGVVTLLASRLSLRRLRPE